MTVDFRYLRLLHLRPAALALTIGLFAASATARQNLVPHQVMDPEGSCVAFTYNLPQGWTALDNVYWNRSLKVNPMSFAMTASTPDHQVLVSYISTLSYDFASNGIRTAGKAPPDKPSDFLVANFQAVHPNVPYQILDRKDVPVPFPYQPTVKGAQPKAYQSSAKIAFDSGGVPSVESLSFNFYSIKYPVGTVTRGNWIVQGMRVVVSPTDEVADNDQIANQILGSAQMTPAFLEKYQKVATQILAQSRAEMLAKQKAAKQRAKTRVVYVHDGGGYGSSYTSRDWHKDCFILHENLRSLNTRIFNYCMGN